MPNTKGFNLMNGFIIVFLAILCIMIALPFVLVVIISLTSENSLVMNGYQFIPKEWSWEAYRIVFQKPDPLLKGYLVTILITVVGTVISLLLTAMTAYPISRLDFRYNRPITFYIFFTMLFNGGLIPFYIMMTQYLHLKNSLLALIIPTLLSPFNIMIMKGFMDKISKEIIESAKVDGAKEFRIFLELFCRCPPLLLQRLDYSSPLAIGTNGSTRCCS